MTSRYRLRPYDAPFNWGAVLDFVNALFGCALCAGAILGLLELAMKLKGLVF